MVAEVVPLPLPGHYTADRKRKWEVHHVDTDSRSILLFDRHHPSAPTCTQPGPSRTAAVKDAEWARGISPRAPHRFRT